MRMMRVSFYFSLVIEISDLVDTSVLIDTLSSVASEKSQEEISEFVKGGAVSLFIDTIKSRGISANGIILNFSKPK